MRYDTQSPNNTIFGLTAPSENLRNRSTKTALPALRLKNSSTPQSQNHTIRKENNRNIQGYNYKNEFSTKFEITSRKDLNSRNDIRKSKNSPSPYL